MKRLPPGAVSALARTDPHTMRAVAAALCALTCVLGIGSGGRALAASGPDRLSLQVHALFAAVEGVEAPGASVLVAKSGEVVHAGGYGLANVELGVPNQTDTVFRLGSITKSLTATAVLQLHDRGLLNIDDTVAEYLPDMPHADEITIRQLLAHTSGITSLEEAPLQFPPGERMDYSNAGYHLLGRIIEHVSGDCYEDYLRKNIFDPLGMASTGYEHHATIVRNRAAGYGIGEGGQYVNAPYQDVALTFSAGALYSTVEDMYRFLHVLFSGRLLKPQTLEQAISPATLNDGRQTGYGLGWMIGSYRGLREIGHGGDITGFNAQVSWFPDYDLTVIVLSNTAMRPAGPLPTARDLVHAIAEIYLSDHMEASTQPTPIALDPAVYQAYSGRYQLEGAPEVLAVMGDTIAITTDGSALFVETKLGKQQIFAESETTFFTLPDEGNRLAFVVDETGRADEIIISLMGVRELRAKRIQDGPG